MKQSTRQYLKNVIRNMKPSDTQTFTRQDNAGNVQTVVLRRDEIMGYFSKEYPN